MSRTAGNGMWIAGTLLALALGFIAGRQQTTRAGSCEVETVLQRCLQRESGEHNIGTLLASPEFGCVASHLDAFLNPTLVDQSGALSILVWRAAMLCGDDTQVSRASQICWCTKSILSADLIVSDLADNPTLASRLLTPEAPRPFLERFLVAVADRDPAQWGFLDYEPFLSESMNKEDLPLDLRIPAAYALSRWRGEEPVGRKALDLLREWSLHSTMARQYLDFQQTLGGRGWKPPPTTQTDQPAKPLSPATTMDTSGQ